MKRVASSHSDFTASQAYQTRIFPVPEEADVGIRPTKEIRDLSALQSVLEELVARWRHA